MLFYKVCVSVCVCVCVVYLWGGETSCLLQAVGEIIQFSGQICSLLLNLPETQPFMDSIKDHVLTNRRTESLHLNTRVDEQLRCINLHAEDLIYSDPKEVPSPGQDI